MSQRRTTGGTRTRARARIRSHNRCRQWAWSPQSIGSMTTSSSPHIWSRRTIQAPQPLNAQSIDALSRKLSVTPDREST
jgi:hypothetical protein